MYEYFRFFELKNLSFSLIIFIRSACIVALLFILAN